MLVIVRETGERVNVRAWTGKDGVERFYCDNGKRRFERSEIEIIGNKKDFCRELKALLEKHNATILWCCDDCSDTHGIYDSHLEIEINGHDCIKFPYDYIESCDL